MKKILIVEDEKSIRNIMSETLSKNFEVLKAPDGQIGIKMALEHKPEIILLDLLMPKMGGQEMLSMLRKNKWGKTVPVVVLTNQDDIESIAFAHEEKLTDYIIKSNVTLDDLVAKVRTAVLSAV